MINLIKEFNKIATKKSSKKSSKKFNISNKNDVIIESNKNDVIIESNKGTGAGGMMTTLNGCSFEKKTSIEKKLLDNDFSKNIINKNKYGYYFELVKENKKIIYFTQSGCKLYLKKEFNIDVYKHPDEAFLIIEDNTFHLKILEKKNQNGNGSVEDKLKTGAFNKKEYSKMLSQNDKYKFTISYAFCVSKFLQNKFESKQIKYKIIKEIMEEDDIKIFYGEDEKYFDILFNWIMS
jgi:hypothetical protein